MIKARSATVDHPRWQKHSPDAGTIAAFPASDMKILVVEPYYYTRRTLTLLLQDLGHEVYRVEQCDETIPFLNSFWPDAILMNYFLGEMNALQLCTEIHELFGEMPKTIIHSSVAEHRAFALRFPEASFLESPFLPEQLQAILSRLQGTDPEAAAFAALTG